MLLLFMRAGLWPVTNETNREDKAIEFYVRFFSSFDRVEHPNLVQWRNAVLPQLSSCYLTTVADDSGWHLRYRENALSKWLAAWQRLDTCSSPAPAIKRHQWRTAWKPS
jgi:hypothetical protein